MSPTKPYIAFDLDGTLAEWSPEQPPYRVGKPVQPMVRLARQALADGKRVCLFTARLRNPELQDGSRLMSEIHTWCELHLGQRVEVYAKPFGMEVLYDDRAVAVEFNTGKILGGTARSWD